MFDIINEEGLEVHQSWPQGTLVLGDWGGASDKKARTAERMERRRSDYARRNARIGAVARATGLTTKEVVKRKLHIIG
jgi:hypothetical protein